MEHEPLKPCPFCGGPAVLMSSYSSKTRSYFVYARCIRCKSQGQTVRCDTGEPDDEFTTPECDTAALFWNTRVKGENQP